MSEAKVSGKLAPFEAAIESRILYEKLRQAKMGDTLTYAEIGAEISRDVQNDGQAYGFMRRAVHWCQTRDRMVFETIPRVGLKRVNDAGTIGVMQNARKRIRGEAHRALGKSSCADYDKLSPDEKRAFNVERAQLGMARLMASERTQKKLATEAEKHETFTEADALKRLRTSGMVK